MPKNRIPSRWKTIKCESCGQEKEVRHNSTTRFCSRICYGSSIKGVAFPLSAIEKSVATRIAKRIRGEESSWTNCVSCSNLFLNKRRYKFCSPVCKNKAREGQNNPMILAGFVGEKHPNYGKPSPNRGTKWTDYQRKVIPEKVSVTISRLYAEGKLFPMVRSKHGKYISTKTGKEERYDSSYELRRMQALDSSPLVKTWTKVHGIRIPYKERKKHRHYIPDFLVQMNDGRQVMEETKGYVFSKMNFARKNLAAKSYCHFRGIEFRLIFRDDLDVVT